VGRNLEPGQTVLEQNRRDQDLALTMVSSQRRKVCLHQSHRRRPCHQNHGDEHRTRSHHGDHVHAGCSLDVTHIDLLCSATPGPAVDSVRTMSVVFRDRNDPPRARPGGWSGTVEPGVSIFAEHGSPDAPQHSVPGGGQPSRAGLVPAGLLRDLRCLLHLPPHRLTWRTKCQGIVLKTRKPR
jgi:hypothetical protein